MLLALIGRMRFHLRAVLIGLIAAVVLFSLGTGAIKGFAITLTIGLITSMFTAVTYTRAIVNLRYGGKRISQLPIGMRIPETGAAANEIKGGKD